MRIGWVSASADRRVASFRYRVEAPAAGLRARGHTVEMVGADGAASCDAVVFSKAYSAEHRVLAREVKRRGGRVVFDLCDNHFYNPFELPKYRLAREQIVEMMSLADRVVCSTPALATVVREQTGGAFAPLVVGDVAERIVPAARPRRAEGPLRLTWFGSHGSPNAPSGITDLLLIRDELEALAARRPIALTVCSNNREKFEQSIVGLRLPTRYVEWSLEDFPQVLATTDAVVLPMTLNPFTACKTHNRLTTALYAGVPVLAVGIESYREFGAYCTLDNWEEGLSLLSEARGEERKRALASRHYIDRRWTMESLAPQWETALAPAVRTADELRLLQDVRLHGRLDAVARGGMVTGWVAAPLEPDLELQVVLECDGEPVAMARADQPRDDLAVIGLPDACGFRLPLPPRVASAAPSRLSVRVLDTHWIVGENPIVLAEGERPRLFAPPMRPASRATAAVSIAAQQAMLETLRAQQESRVEAARMAAKAALDPGGGAGQGEPERASPPDGMTVRRLLRAGADSRS